VTTAFLGETLGLDLDHAWDDEGGRGALYVCGGGFIEVFEAKPGEAVTRPVGMALSVEMADVDTWHDTLREQGVPVVGPLGDKPWGHRSFQIETPDGVPITFFEKLLPA
jgi:uncharacterized glyoxalase superfamily protein PhnB